MICISVLLVVPTKILKLSNNACRSMKTSFVAHSCRFQCMLVSGSFEFLLKLGTLPGHRLDYVFSATEALRITDASGLLSCTVTLNAPLMVTDSISGTMKMFGRKVKSDPVSNYLFN